MRFSTNFQRKKTTGISPEHPKTQLSAKPNGALSTDAEQLTVKSTISHLELLEIRECAPFRRDPASELVRVVIQAADVEHLE